MSERKRCPNGSRKDKRLGACVRKGERGEQKEIKIINDKKNIRNIIMSTETRRNYENALQSLKRSQVVDLFKKIKKVLELNVGKKTKGQLVNEIMELHGTGSKPNMYAGKQLLSFDKDSHIKIPRRETIKEGRQAKAEKEVTKSKKKVEELTKQKRDTELKILNQQKRQKTKQVETRAKQSKLSGILEDIANLRRRSKGASASTLKELGKELVVLKKRLADAKK